MLDPHMPSLRIPLTNEQAYLYRTNAAFKSMVDTFLNAHLPLYLQGAALMAREHEGRMRDEIARLNETPFRKVMTAEEFRDLTARHDCDICLGTGVDYLGRPCRIHGPKTEEQGE